MKRRQPFVIELSIIAKSLITPAVFGVRGVVEDGQGRILLVRHSYIAGWHLPGGGVDRGEPPENAVVREVEEEVGLMESTPPEFIALYSQKVFWVTNVVGLYRLRNARIDFKPNLEIREAQFFDLATLPVNTTAATQRRLAELTGKVPRTPYW
ncbi:MAG: NUDIX domain-containing protein [Proteobacteria bacterium]|nr:NUDIX domain-containing protein [Pseudomonadota bacterium]